MKYLKVILPIILLSGLLFHSNVYAYKPIFGLLVPTNLDEVKFTYLDIKNNYIGKVVPFVKTNEKIIDIKKPSVINEIDQQEQLRDNLVEMEISEKELNEFLSKYAKGKRYEQFTLKEISVLLVENQIIADILVNQISANVVFQAVDNGAKLEIVDIKSGSENYITGLKNAIMKVAFKAMQPKLMSLYLKDFDSVKIETGKITVYLKN